MFRKNKPVVEFLHSSNKIDLPKPAVSSKFFPNWFKKVERFKDIDTTITQGGTVKNCIPFIESMSLGYTIPAWCDIKIVVSEHFKVYDERGVQLKENYPLIEFPIGSRENFIGWNYGGGVVARSEPAGLGAWAFYPQSIHNEIGTPQTHIPEQVPGIRFTNDAPNPLVMKLISPWTIKTPKGYSVLFKNPSNNFDNDIQIFEGVVDTDRFHYRVNFPFFWSGTKKGVFNIKRGTPLIQVIPFKRSDALKLEIGIEEQKMFINPSFTDSYKNIFWHKTQDKN